MSKGKDDKKSEKPEKTRTLGKVQWERDRRNRLKDAFSILEKLVTSADGTDCEKDKLSNIETLHKAAILIEKLQTQVLNMSIRLKEPSEESIKEIRIYLKALSQKCRDLKIVLRKLVTSNRKQRIDLKEKPNTRIPVKRLRQRPKQKNKENLSKLKRPARPPLLLPKQTLKNGLKNGILPSTAENQTLVFLRPNLVLPSPPPTFLLLPPNTLTQPPLSISGPTAPTSTTTVNRLPIPAYSHALSANTKVMNNINPVSNYTVPRRVSCHTRWRILRALRQNDKSNKGKKKKDVKDAKPDTKSNETKLEADAIHTNNKKIDMTVTVNENTENAKDALVEVVSIIEKSIDIPTTNAETIATSVDKNQMENAAQNNANLSEIVVGLQNTDSEKDSDLTKETAEAPPSKKIKTSDYNESEAAKPVTVETKTPVEAIEDNNCEVVDAVNSDVAGAGSRLELAEELLAASPTAAFLLTFPLVSGTRPDTPEDNSRTQSDRNLGPTQNSDGLDGLASFFTGKEQFSNKSWMPEQPPKIEFPSKEISSCAMSNVYNSIKNPAPVSIPDTLHSMTKQRQVDSNHIYKQNDNITHDNISEKNVNKCYNFGMQDGTKMPNNYFAKSQSKEPTPAPRQIIQTKIPCENNSYFHNSYLQNHGPTFSSQTKSSNVYPDYNIPNIYSQSVNMWNEEVTYHDLNTVQNVEGNSKQTSRYNYPTHYSNESHNFYKPFVPATSASSMKTDCNQKAKLKQSIPDAKCNDERIMTAKKPTIKGPVNWMTSEARSYASNMKFDHATYPLDPSANINNENALNTRKADYQDTTQFYSLPTSNYSFQMNFEDCQQNWNTPKLAKADDLQLDPPSTLPTLIGDLALGTLERKRPMHTVVPPPIPIVSTQETFPPSTTFFSVSHLVENTSTSVPTSRSQFSKSRPTKPESNIESFPYYNTVPIPPQQPKNSVSSCAQPRQYKNKPDVNANAKQCKTNYSAEALIRGVPHTNWMDSKPLQDPQFSQMPHFPPVLDLGETLPQQYTTNSFCYGTAPTTVAPSFYPSHSFMPSNYMGSGFLPDIMDFSNVSSDNNFSLPRLDPKKKENSQNKNAIDQKTLLFNLKQKADSFKKDSNKKQNQKRPKGHIEQSWLTGAEMNASAAITSPLLTDDTFLSYFPTSQVYQSTPTFPVSSHTAMEPFVGMPPSQQSSCSVTTTIATAKANFNLSTIFPEINKQQNTSTTYCANVPGSARQSHIKHPQEYQFRNIN